MDNEFSHSRIAKQALECTHMQAELLYHVMNLFEHAMVVTSRSNLSLDTILTHFIKHMWFKTDRVHALFNGMCSLFEDNQVCMNMCLSICV